MQASELLLFVLNFNRPKIALNCENPKKPIGWSNPTLQGSPTIWNCFFLKKFYVLKTNAEKIVVNTEVISW